MSRYVIDASVAVKWGVPEVHSASANRLLTGSHVLIAPDFLLVEIANAFLKKVRQDLVSKTRAIEAMSHAKRVCRLSDCSALSAHAFDLALMNACSVYDAIYAALALAERCEVVTADRRFFEALSSALPRTMLWIEDVPGPR